MSILTAQRLTRHYGRRVGIHRIDLAVSEGEIFGFLGPNGAGKTTTIRVLRLLKKHPDLPLEEIARRLHIEFKNASEHLRKLSIAGLVEKCPAGRWVQHKIAPRGSRVVTFLSALD